MICTLALATSGIAFATTKTSIHERVGGAQIVSTVDVTIIGAAEIGISDFIVPKHRGALPMVMRKTVIRPCSELLRASMDTTKSALCANHLLEFQ